MTQIEAEPEPLTADPFPAVAKSRAKRTIDLIVAVAVAIIAVPVLFAVALIIVIESPGSPLYSQLRAGCMGRPFRIWKLRTMRRDADRLRASYAGANEAPWPTFKLTHDPRVTRVGRFLRRASLDELPQLWNVLVGDMSIVGPRPLPTYENELLDNYQRRRLEARPGITGLWQVTNRHSSTGSTFAEWVEQDLEYIRNWSVRLDLAIMWQTIGAIVRMTGK